MYYRTLLLTLLISSSAGAQTLHRQFVDGNSLHRDCEARRPHVREYILGAFDAYTQLADRAGLKSICLSENVSAGQLRDVVCSYLSNNPSKRHIGASALVAAATVEAFPCQ